MGGKLHWPVSKLAQGFQLIASGLVQPGMAPQGKQDSQQYGGKIISSVPTVITLLVNQF